MIPHGRGVFGWVGVLLYAVSFVLCGELEWGAAVGECGGGGVHGLVHVCTCREIVFVHGAMYVHTNTPKLKIAPTQFPPQTCPPLSKPNHPHRGTVLLDDTPLPHIDHRFLHTQVALVSQEPLLFADTLRFNICFGVPGGVAGVTQEDIESAARQANAHDFIMQFPEGCVVCEGVLSGGALCEGV